MLPARAVRPRREGGGLIMLTRRDLLRTSAALGAAAVLGSRGTDAEARRLRGGSVLAARARRPGQRQGRPERLRADRIPRPDAHAVALCATELRRPPLLRAHLDPALHRMAVPRRDRRG